MKSKMSKFKLKEDDSAEVEIFKEDVQEIVPDADFRFSLIILSSGEKHFVCGSEREIREELNIESD
jgi:hypothetical protein